MLRWRRWPAIFAFVVCENCTYPWQQWLQTDRKTSSSGKITTSVLNSTRTRMRCFGDVVGSRQTQNLFSSFIEMIASGLRRFRWQTQNRQERVFISVRRGKKLTPNRPLPAPVCLPQGASLKRSGHQTWSRPGKYVIKPAAAGLNWCFSACCTCELLWQNPAVNRPSRLLALHQQEAGKQRSDRISWTQGKRVSQ